MTTEWIWTDGRGTRVLGDGRTLYVGPTSFGIRLGPTLGLHCDAPMTREERVIAVELAAGVRRRPT